VGFGRFEPNAGSLLIGWNEKHAREFESVCKRLHVGGVDRCDLVRAFCAPNGVEGQSGNFCHLGDREVQETSRGAKL